MNVYERIEWLRRRLPKKTGSRAFGPLIGRSESWLSVLKLRAGESPDATVDLATARSIAAATGARVEWIVDGTGEPYEVEERYPEREQAIADYDSLPDDVVTEVRSMRFHSGSRPTKDRWKSYIDATLLAKAKGERLGKPLADEDDRPPEARR